jgi:ammonium transporter, Amt family
MGSRHKPKYNFAAGPPPPLGPAHQTEHGPEWARVEARTPTSRTPRKAEQKGTQMAELNTGDTAWVLMSAAMVMLMTPALAFFYGGLVRQKNVLATLMHSFFMLGLISVQWVLWGYSIAFGPTIGGFIGAPVWLGLNGVGAEPNADYAATIPHLAFMAFQMMFAVITPALITGAFAERKRFKAFVVFSLLWATFVYDPLAHWVWGVGGWLRTMGALDFAGGTVVHISAGVAALVAAMMLGRRKGFGTEPMEPHNVPYVVLGAGVLWFGWFGFNAGSALGANGLAANALVTTHVAAAMAAVTWATVSWAANGRPSVVGAACGAVAGLVAVTPAAGYITPAAAILIGLGAGVFCFWAVKIVKDRLGVDDSLDVVGVHGVGGIWGAIATGLFATKTVNSAGADGLFYGNPQQLVVQLLAVGATCVLSAVLTFVILKIVDLTVGLRVTETEEEHGLDRSQHGELAYQP